MDKTIFELIIERFGEQVQIDKIQEEAQELALALHQYKCPTKCKIEGMEKIYDELADMTIMMEQVKLLFNKERIDEIVVEKLQRVQSKYL